MLGRDVVSAALVGLAIGLVLGFCAGAITIDYLVDPRGICDSFQMVRRVWRSEPDENLRPWFSAVRRAWRRFAS